MKLDLEGQLRTPALDTSDNLELKVTQHNVNHYYGTTFIRCH